MERIYLDSKDLISLAEKKTKEFSDEFKETLKKNSATLIYSMHNIMECSAPYVMGGKESTAMRTLNFLEDVPHKYIAEAKIHLLELKEAISAYSENREYQSIEVPFVPRFDYTVSAFQEPPTANYIKYGLSQIIYELANEDKSLFEGYGVIAQKIKQSLKKDRDLSNYKNHKKNFSNSLTKDLKLYNVAFPVDEIEDLAEWIYQDINRCPGYRLSYEVYHKLLRNLGDAGEDSDIPDFAHISCTPYMNIITLDNRMRGYVEQVDKSIGSNYQLKVKKNLAEVRNAL
jgi:hypothetical protein